MKNNLLDKLVDSERMSDLADSLPYITGMGYRSLCDFHYDEFSKNNPQSIDQFDGMKIFVKTDFLSEFKNLFLPHIQHLFFLYCHNSDLSFNPGYAEILNSPLLVKCFSQNVNFVHDKLFSIPIGLANKRWPHGNIQTLEEVKSNYAEKENLFYCNFAVETNPNERGDCLSHLKSHNISKRKPFRDYLIDLSRSYFCASPSGNGFDSHRNWESLYLKTVPIVTRCINIEFYKDYPLIILDSWSDFPSLNLSEELYKSTWENFEYNLLYMKC